MKIECNVEEISLWYLAETKLPLFDAIYKEVINSKKLVNIDPSEKQRKQLSMLLI
ncbi:hypothetical protein GCM10023116_35650 [Kistimonas scapharcae]|uniref:Uncharacterized protein n=1 Tax=Kistimonas scapharcae TaxID=1036133 RepID=A0ABP8V5V2_9GAMM